MKNDVGYFFCYESRKIFLTVAKKMANIASYNFISAQKRMVVDCVERQQAIFYGWIIRKLRHYPSVRSPKLRGYTSFNKDGNATVSKMRSANQNFSEKSVRGSLKTQVTAVLRCILAVGMSRHNAKIEYGHSPYIHAVGTFEKTAQRLWPLCSWLRKHGTCDLELLTSDIVRKFLLERLDYHRKQGNCRQSFKVEVAALGSLERVLTEFSRRNRAFPVSYDFSSVRLSFTQQSKLLPKYTSTYQGRALANPDALIDALLLPEHKLMASLQLLCGCRTEGVGARTVWIFMRTA
jgi:hypothetical protein